MKNVYILLMALALVGMMNSCAPVYKCGDPIPDKKPGNKRLKAVITERDELCITLANREKENAAMSKEINLLTKEKNELDRNYAALIKTHDELDTKYKNLINENLSQADQFSRAIQMKSEELDSKSEDLRNKEQLLVERERSLNEMKQMLNRQDSITRQLNDVLRNAMLGFNADELSVEIKNGKVYVSMSDRLLFKSGSAAVEVKGKEAIKLLAGVLDKNPDIEILVEGHTDNVPIKTAVFKDNWDLSVARATSIVRILTDDHKITPTRITASGKGEFLPRATNETAEGRALNRRTEIILSPRLDEIMKLLNLN
ncbi:MAG: OmpA family protein [Bacteroidales bacterium]|nr:OmpA family protein [Bacteroidales bacterium]